MKSDSKIQEYRQDLLTGEWVLVAGKRGDRPDNFKQVRSAEVQSNLSKVVNPFQAIVEEKATDEDIISVIRDESGKGLVYVVANRFPLVELSSKKQELSEGPYTGYSGYGSHEVCIYRDATLPVRDFSTKKMQAMFQAFQQRSLELMKESPIKHIFILHNHGKQAGASLLHPHSQLIAAAIVPDGIQRMVEGAKAYHTAHKRTVASTVVDHERSQGKRLVVENEDYVAFTPYASRSAFEIEIHPKDANAHFAFISQSSRNQVAKIYKEVLQKLYRTLGDVDYNMYIYSAPCDGQDYQYFRWFIRLTPRMSIWGGYESGADMDICTVFPEDAAKVLRDK